MAKVSPNSQNDVVIICSSVQLLQSVPLFRKTRFIRHQCKRNNLNTSVETEYGFVAHMHALQSAGFQYLLKLRLVQYGNVKVLSSSFHNMDNIFSMCTTVSYK